MEVNLIGVHTVENPYQHCIARFLGVFSKSTFIFSCFYTLYTSDMQDVYQNRSILYILHCFALVVRFFYYEKQVPIISTSYFSVSFLV